MTVVESKSQKAQTGRLSGKIALVTGGSRGIGAAIALKLAGEGATVAFSYVSNKDAAEKVAGQIRELGGTALAVKGNVASKEDSDALVAAVSKLGKIDILVNNAAIFEGGSIAEVGLDQYDKLFNVNVRGVVATTIAALPYLNDGGRIINISSGAARNAMGGFSLYSATKAALESLTRVWAQDLGARKITVNAVAPGTTLTEMLDQALPPEVKAHYVTRTALGRLGEPVDIADVVAFLASDEGRWVTGTTISADGGLIN